MKRVLVLLALGVFVVAGVTSCKKCVTCEWQQNGVTLVTYAEVCGSSKEIDDWKATVNSLYTGTDFEFVCEE